MSFTVYYNYLGENFLKKAENKNLEMIYNLFHDTLSKDNVHYIKIKLNDGTDQLKFFNTIDGTINYLENCFYSNNQEILEVTGKCICAFIPFEKVSFSCCKRKITLNRGDYVICSPKFKIDGLGVVIVRYK